MFSVLLLLSWVFLAPAVASGHSPADKNVKRITGLRYLEDRSRTHTLKTVPHEKFVPSSNAEFNFGLYDGYLWLYLKVGDLEQKKLFLEIKNPLLDEVEVYSFKEQTWVFKGKSGDQVYSKNKTGRFHQFKVKPNEELLLKVQNLGDELKLPISILFPKERHDRNLWEQYFLGAYFGVLLFVLLGNLFVLLLLRERTNVFYFGYLLSMLFLQLGLVGYGKEIIWPNQPFFANSAPISLGSLVILFGVFFAQAILGTKKHMPTGHKILNIFSGLLIVTLILSLIPNNAAYRFSGLSIYILSFLSVIGLMYLGYTSYKRGYKPARFFFLGFVVLFVFICIFILHNFGLLPTNFFTEYSLLIGSLGEVSCLTFALIDTFSLHKERTLKTLVKINKLQTEQNANLEKGVEERTIEIKEKNRELEEKSKEILDSIQYAKLIQKGLMQRPESFSDYFEDSFVLFSPKDIVSGDFYWLTEVNTKNQEGQVKHNQVLCVADCTGHGVPGAIISVLGLQILNGVFKQNDVVSPADALNELNKEFNGIFGKDLTSREMSNGMDAVVCSINKEDMTLQFAGAKNNLYIVRQGEIIKLTGDRLSIGQSKKEHNYKLNYFALEKGDCIYITTDGYVDQFGGPKNKKLKFTFLKNYISTNYELPMTEQKNAILENLLEWIGPSGEQTDDICVIGFRV